MSGSEPEVGASYLVAEDDYRFGLGCLRVDVIAIIGSVHFGEAGRVELWWHLRAVCRAPDDVRDRPGHERELYVPASALRRARRGG